MMSSIDVEFPPKVKPLFKSKKRFIILAGGRGSAKSWSVAAFLIISALKGRKRILCAREIQRSIKDSVHKLLADTIERYGLQSHFDIRIDSIRCVNGSEFIFKGLYRNQNEIKSTEGIDLCWIEEAQSTSAGSLDILAPTIRKAHSQIIMTFNQTNEDDAVYSDYYLPAKKGEREDVEVIDINWKDNKNFPEVLLAELEWDKEHDHDKYLHKWEGHILTHSSSQIMNGKWEITDFEADEGTKFLFGADWGFSNDPMALVRMFIKDECLWIDYDRYGVGVEIDDYVSFFEAVPESRHNKIVADSARPESIRYMQTKGFFVVPSKKGPGSIEDGIKRIRGFKRIYINPRCKHTADEFRFYSYKMDRRTGIVSNIPEDTNNHIIDSIRYATEDTVQFVRRRPRMRVVTV